MYILGVSALYHDSAASLIKDGDIIAAAQEERFTRKKHDTSIPVNAITYCLDEAGISPDDLQCIVFYDNPIMTMDRFIGNLRYVKDDCDDLLDFTYQNLFGTRIWVHDQLKKKIGFKKKIEFYVADHHISHGASAYYPSPFDDAAIITMDGVGEWATTTIGYGKGNDIKILKQINYPHSIGLLYSAFTYFCGFKVNSGDYKLMGLAPYGRPIYYDVIKERIIDIKPDGSYRLNLDYFDFQYGRAMTNYKFAKLFGGDRRKPESEITRREMDMAASVQKIVEEVLILTAKTARRITGSSNLVLAGGVALNCVANGKLIKEKIFDNIWIQPAAGDAGGSLGCALYAYYGLYKNARNANGHDTMNGSYLGPSFSDEEIEKWLKDMNYTYHKYDKNELEQFISQEIQNIKVIGLFEGRMEFGPRALGNRSIIGNAQSEYMQSQINLKIKYRESFRLFAPSVLAEDISDYFDISCESPYMLLCADVKNDRKRPFDLEKMLDSEDANMLPIVNTPRSDIPAVTHVDYSARIQSVDKETNESYYGIIKRLKEDTGCSVIINTSFNVRGEPIVCTPEDAYLCFMRTEMDVLVLNRFVLLKQEQKALESDNDWRRVYELD